MDISGQGGHCGSVIGILGMEWIFQVRVDTVDLWWVLLVCSGYFRSGWTLWICGGYSWYVVGM